MYPTFNNPVQHKTRQQLQMLGINQSDNYVEGQLEDCVGITTKRFPYFSTRDKLVEQERDYNVLSMFAWEELFVVSDIPDQMFEVEGSYFQCFYGGQYVGMLSDELPKQYAVINSKLVIWPDMKYLNLYDQIKSINNLCTATKLASLYEAITFYPAEDGNPAHIYIATRRDITFTVGNKLFFTGLTNSIYNATYTIDSVTRGSNGYDINIEEPIVTNWGQVFSGNYTIWDVGDGSLKVIPDMDYICSSNNRLWGCSSKNRTIYASALGEPDNFYDFSGLATDSFAVPVGTADEFTGCIALPSAILFMKQHTIHKILGSYPAEYTAYDYQIDGVTKDNARTLINCNGTAVFCSEYGISTYYGSSNGTLSKDLNIDGIHEGVACYNGENYILSCKDTSGAGHLYVYDMKYNIWTKIADMYADDVIHFKDKDYILNEGKIYQIDSGIDLDGDWMITFKPFIETQTDRYNNRSGVFNKKRYWKIYVRIEIKKGSTFQVEIKADNGRFHNAGRIAGDKDEVRTLYIKTDRCDKAQLRLSGHGPMTILGIERDFTIGSTR